jgi:acyl-CoA synthetase (AMP-forming)/AMP-acid ligase II
VRWLRRQGRKGSNGTVGRDAFVRPAAGTAPSESELAAYCAERLARYKVPRYWEFVRTFLMTASGKVQKFVLRDRITAARQAAGPDREAARPGRPNQP